MPYDPSDRAPSAPSFPAILDVSSQKLGPDGLAGWIADAQDTIRTLIGAHGAILFRGTGVSDEASFSRAAQAYTPELLAYVGGGSPRTARGNGVYTSTELAAQAPIPLHCEAAYLPVMPRHVWFYCHIAAPRGGATPIGDMRRVAARLDPELVDTFRSRGVLYVSNLHDGKGFGKSWAAAYESDDRAVVEARLIEQDAEYEWTGDGGLRVLMRQPALRPHPETGQEIWVNQAVNWHPAHLGGRSLDRLAKVFGTPMKYPKMVFFGDGCEIPLEAIGQIQAALEAEEVATDWRPGDIMLLDNRVIAHGRRPFEGERAVYVALA